MPAKRTAEEIAAAKAKEAETRKALGPRLPRSERAPFKPTAAPRTPRATGSPGDSMKGH